MSALNSAGWPIDYRHTFGKWTVRKHVFLHIIVHCPVFQKQGTNWESDGVDRVKVLVDEGENSLAVQWLGLCPSNVGGTGSISGQGTKIPHAVLHGGGKKFYYWLHLMSYPLSAVRKRKLEDDWNGAYGGNLKILSRTLTEL